LLVDFSKLLISIEQEDMPDPKWNDRLVQSGLGTIYQAAEIAGHHIRVGRRPFCLKFVNKRGDIVGQLLLNEDSRFSNSSFRSRLLKKIPALKQLVYGWSYGPVIFDKSVSEEIYSVLGHFLIQSNRVISGWQNPLCIVGVEGLGKKFELKKWSTFIIDLTKPTDELYHNIDKHSGRKNIERSIQRGVNVEEIHDNNFEDYAKLRMEQENNVDKSRDIQQRLKWWLSVKKLGYSGLLAKKNDTSVGGILFSSFNSHIIEVGVARSEEDTKQKLYSQDLLKWKIIEWGQKNKMRFYNLSGFNPQPQSKKEEGIFRYKKKWGGKRYDFWRILYS